jgi:hypothetical protein
MRIIIKHRIGIFSIREIEIEMIDFLLLNEGLSIIIIEGEK